MNSLPKTVTRQHRGCILNPGPSVPSPAHKYKQFLNLCLFWVRVVFVCIFTGFVCIFVCFCVSLDHFGFCVLVLLRFVFLVPSQEVGWKEHV